MKSLFMFLFLFFLPPLFSYVDENDQLRLNKEFDKWKSFSFSGNEKERGQESELDEIEYSLSARKVNPEISFKDTFDINALEESMGTVKDIENIKDND